MTLVCVICEVPYRTVKIGGALLTHDDDGQPYQLYSADILQCPGCGSKISRPASVPMNEHFNPNFVGVVEGFEKRGTLVRAFSAKVKR
jgi:hypothetical protein